MNNQNGDIYDRINDLLRQQGKTKVDLAKSTEIPLSTITSLFQRKSKNMKLESVKAIGGYLGVSVDYLIMGYEQPQRTDEEVNSNINFSKMDYEIMRISRGLSYRDKTALLAKAFELEEKTLKEEEKAKEKEEK